jgi:hypothetical protein
MDLSVNEDHELITGAVQTVCAEFDDEHWSNLEEAHELPWEFSNRALSVGVVVR